MYARVSTNDKEQDPETQLYALRNFCRDADWQVYIKSILTRLGPEITNTALPGRSSGKMLGSGSSR